MDFQPVIPVQAERVFHVPAYLLNSTLNVADALHKTVVLESAGECLVETTVTGLLDTGAQVDMVTRSLVDRLVESKLCSPTTLHSPMNIGSVKDEIALQITEVVELSGRLGDEFFTHTFGIADIPAPPHLILGKPWMEKFAPEAIRTLERLGTQVLTSPESPGLTNLEVKHVTTPALYPDSGYNSGTVTPAEPVLAFGPSTNPQKAFSAGGGNCANPDALCAAIEAEQARRKQAEDLMHARLTVRQAVCHQLGQHDPGVQGLTGNREGWEEQIPARYRKYIPTLFTDALADHLPPPRPGTDCTIVLKEGSTLTPSKPYAMSQEQLRTLKAIIDKDLARSFIQPSDASSSSSPFFVTDPTTKQLRLVFDYQEVNAATVPDVYPLPLTRRVLGDLAGCDWATCLDAREAFKGVRMEPGSRQYTAFTTPFGLFEWNVMPMGLRNAPSVFQRFMNSVLNPFLGITCHAYLDDIVIYTKGTKEEHEAEVEKILAALEKASVRIKPHKCQWSVRKFNFLGFTIECGKGIRMADDKIQGIRDLKRPVNLASLRHFLGTVGYYDQLIPHFSDITACLTDLSKKGAAWEWEPQHEAAFQRLLSSVKDDVFLYAFDPEKQIRLSTDASDVAYGGMMEQQDDEGNWRPFLFYHHKFKDGEKGWDGPDKELYAIVFAFQHYRQFLAQPRFPVQVFSDHRNLSKFMFKTNMLKSHDGRTGRWWEELSQCNFEIQYVEGTKNVVPDFLSRYNMPPAADLPERVLLPAHRFSTKARADIESWFKKHAHVPNVRQTLEEQFSGTKKNSSVRPGSETPSEPDACQAPAPPSDFPCVAARPRLYAMLAKYQGTSLDSVLPDPTHTRRGADRRGIGHP